MLRQAIVAIVLTVLAACAVARQADHAPSTQPKETVMKAKVVSVTGSAQKLVSSNGAGKWQALRAGEELGELTVIRTGFRSKVVLKFSDRGEVTIDRATKVGIGEFRKNRKVVRAKIGLKYGTIRANVAKSAGPNDFQIDTPVATLSVRGTMGRIGFTGDMGLGMRGTAGSWNIASGNRRRTIRPGEATNSNLAPSKILAQKRRDTRMGDALGGLSRREVKNLRQHGNGRGIVRFTGSKRGTTAPLILKPTIKPLYPGIKH